MKLKLVKPIPFRLLKDEVAHGSDPQVEWLEGSDHITMVALGHGSKPRIAIYGYKHPWNTRIGPLWYVCKIFSTLKDAVQEYQELLRSLKARRGIKLVLKDLLLSGEYKVKRQHGRWYTLSPQEILDRLEGKLGEKEDPHARTP